MAFPFAPVAGALLGGGLGAIFGGGKRTGIGRAEVKGLDIHQRSFMRGIQNVEALGQNFLNAFKSVSPVFGALESRVLSDLNDATRTQRLEEAFQSRLGQQQAASGVFRSPSSALNRAFGGLQFGEQSRNQAFQNAFGFQQAFGQPLASSLFGAAFPNLNGQEMALQGLALSAGARSAQQQSILGGISSGFGIGTFFGGGGEFGGGAGGGAGGGYLGPSNRFSHYTTGLPSPERFLNY